MTSLFLTPHEPVIHSAYSRFSSKQVNIYYSRSSVRLGTLTTRPGAAMRLPHKREPVRCFYSGPPLSSQLHNPVRQRRVQRGVLCDTESRQQQTMGASVWVPLCHSSDGWRASRISSARSAAADCSLIKSVFQKRRKEGSQYINVAHTSLKLGNGFLSHVHLGKSPQRTLKEKEKLGRLLDQPSCRSR